MDKTAALASGILQGIGGEQNIQRLENCMTRVRVEVHDDDQLDVPRLKQLSGVVERFLASRWRWWWSPWSALASLFTGWCRAFR